jgi:hypothetical protein
VPVPELLVLLLFCVLVFYYDRRIKRSDRRLILVRRLLSEETEAHERLWFEHLRAQRRLAFLQERACRCERSSDMKGPR